MSTEILDGQPVPPDVYVAVCRSSTFVPAMNNFECWPTQPAWSEGEEFYCQPEGCYFRRGWDGSISAYLNDDSTGALPAPTGFAGASSPGSGQPFEFSSAQQAEVYSAMVIVFGLFVAALALAWGLKSIVRIFNWHGNKDD